MNKILVTGASGFVGTHLIQALLEKGETEIFAAVYGNGRNLSKFLSPNQIISGNLADSSFTQELIKTTQPGLIYHLASLSVVQDSVEKAAQILASNLTLQYNLLESVRLYAPKSRFLAICSANEYGLVKEKDLPIDEETPLRPLNAYAVSKASQDLLAYQYFLAHDLDVVRLRPFNHTGEGQTVDFLIPALVQQFVEITQGKKEPKLTVGNMASIRDFTDVKDMVQAYILAAEKCLSGEVYNIGSGIGLSVSEVIKLLQEISGVKVEISNTKEKMRPSDVPVLIADAGKFHSVTGWEPKIKFKETLTRVYNYMKEQNV